MARAFRAEGATVVGVDLNEGDAGDLNLRADVTDEQQVAGMYGRTKQEYGRIDVLVNNAGHQPARGHGRDRHARSRPGSGSRT